jgi:hypothetical protein
MKAFVQRIDASGLRTIDDLSGREKLLWELGIICPVEYLEGGPVAHEYLDAHSAAIIERRHEAMKKLRFKVFFDGVEIRKPILLPTSQLRSTSIDDVDQDQAKDVRVYPIDIRLKVPKDGRVTAEGYLLFQPYNVHPQELRGLYPRVQYVGVGSYDSSIFKSFRAEIPLLRVQLSGELYVLEGLTDSLNLDRSGFIELDEGFQALRKFFVDFIEKSDQAIVRRVGKARSERVTRRSRLKKERRKSQVFEEITTHLKRLSPGYKAVSKDLRELKEEGQAVSYGIVAIDHSRKSIYVDPNATDSTLVAVIVAADNYLRTLSDSREVRAALAEQVRDILERGA